MGLILESRDKGNNVFEKQREKNEIFVGWKGDYGSGGSRGFWFFFQYYFQWDRKILERMVFYIFIFLRFYIVSLDLGIVFF